MTLLSNHFISQFCKNKLTQNFKITRESPQRSIGSPVIRFLLTDHLPFIFVKQSIND
jgi:hypothetical protein